MAGPRNLLRRRSFDELLPVGRGRLQWHPAVAVFVGSNVGRRPLLLDGIDGHVVGAHSVALGHGPPVTPALRSETVAPAGR